jgi:hypothetical protein
VLPGPDGEHPEHAEMDEDATGDLQATGVGRRL